ncbi:MAG: site-specific integrase [Oligoflexia bacterium]|nr:site-specific integrase [Oligoflexia bacterium]
MKKRVIFIWFQYHQIVKKCQPFAAALKSFLGYLEGTEKSAHTIKNYRLDVLAFHSFLERQSGAVPVRMDQLSVADLERYHDYLKATSQKTNTRRRKLLTAHRFLRYLSKRNQLAAEIPTKLPAPHKVERVPLTFSRAELVERIATLPKDTILDRRNRALLRLLAETGCLVSEIGQLRFRDLEGVELSIPGKAARKVAISEELAHEVAELRSGGKSILGADDFIFLGYNRHGPLKEAISPRGVELLVRFYATKLECARLTPRNFRHSAVLAWFQEGIAQAEIQRRLGLKTPYAFRTFAPLLSEASAKPRN